MYLIFLIILKLCFLNQIFSRTKSANSISHFKDTLFIVKYNYDTPINQILLHFNLWNSVFINQFISGPFNSLKIEQLRGMLPKVFNTYISSCIDDDFKGYYAYASVLNAMKLFPHFKGYLFAHDDMAINITSLMQFDLSTVWITENDFRGYTLRNIDLQSSVYKKGEHIWGWLHKPCGSEAIERLIQKDEYIRLKIKHCTGSDKVWYSGQSDFFYIPQNYYPVFVDVLGKFIKEKIFLELAIPTFVECFVNKLSFDQRKSKVSLIEKIPIFRIRLCEYWSGNRENISYLEPRCITYRHSLIHPLKLSRGTPTLNLMIKKMDVNLNLNSILNLYNLTKILY